MLLKEGSVKRAGIQAIYLKLLFGEFSILGNTAYRTHNIMGVCAAV